MDNTKALKQFDFNLSRSNEVAEGKVLFFKDEIRVIENGKVLETFETDKVEKLEVSVNIGTATLLAFVDGIPYIVCNFTNKHLTEFSTLTKYYNFDKASVDTFEEVRDDRCPKCGLPYLSGTRICNRCTKKSAVFGRMLKLLNRHKSKIALVVGINLLVYAIIIGTPMLQRTLMNDYIAPQRADKRAFLLIIGALFTFAGIRSILQTIRGRVNAKFSQQITAGLRQDIFEKVQGLSLKDYEKRTQGSIINRMTSDTERLRRFLAYELIMTLNQVILAVGIIALLLILNWKMALLIVAPILLACFILSNYFRYMNRRYERQWAARSKSTNILVDILQGVRVVKVFGTEKKEVKRFTDSSKYLADISEKNEVIWHLIFPWVMALLFFGQILVAYFGGSSVLAGNMSLADLYLFYTFASLLFDPLMQAASLPRWLAESVTSAAKIFDILDEPMPIKENEVDLSIEGNVDIKNLTFGYKPYAKVLDDVSFSAKKGDMIGIVGKTGAGKTTLISLLMNLFEPTGGEINIDGVNLKDISNQSLRSQLGVVMQDNFLFGGSIYDNVAYAKPEATHEEIIKVCKMANAHDFIMQLSDGYNTIIGEKGYTLSGGERQRISIARALLANPKLLVLDEATSSLDTETEKLIQDALAVIIKDRTTFAIAHRLSTLRNATKIIVIADHKIAELGTHDELMEQQGIYYNLVNAQREMLKQE